jgi:ribonuclease HII
MARRLAAPQDFLPIEREVQAAGHEWIAGLDEAGRGPLAGPVVAAAVILPTDCHILGLQDSKRLTARQREVVYTRIQQQAVAYGIGSVSSMQIDRHNILWATKEAMLEALYQLQRVPDILLIDGITALPTTIAQRLITGGDACCASIAAASVLAKVTRDRLMIAYAETYPAYGFDKHKGYPTPAHYARLRIHGPCVIHRVSFKGVLPEIGNGRGGENA